MSSKIFKSSLYVILGFSLAFSVLLNFSLAEVQPPPPNEDGWPPQEQILKLNPETGNVLLLQLVSYTDTQAFYEPIAVVLYINPITKEPVTTKIYLYSDEIFCTNNPQACKVTR